MGKNTSTRLISESTTYSIFLNLLIEVIMEPIENPALTT